MISSINVNNNALGSTFINQRELKQAEDLLAKNMDKEGNIDYSGKTRAEINELGDATNLYISSLMPEEEKQNSFTMDMAITEQIYNKNALPSDVTQTSAFKQAESSYGSQAAANSSMAKNALDSGEEALEIMQKHIEEKALEAEEKAKQEIKQEQAQQQAERLDGNSNTITAEASVGASQAAQVSAPVETTETEIEAEVEAASEVKVEAKPSSPSSDNVDVYV